MLIQIKNVITTMYKYAKSVFISKIFIVLVSGILVPVNAKVMQNLIDNMILYINKEINLNIVIIWTGILFSILLIDIILNAVNQFIDIACDKKLINNFEPDLIKKYRNLEYSNYEDKDTRNIIYRMSGQPFMRIKSLFMQLMTIVQVLITLIGLIALYANVSVMLVAFTVVLLIPMLIVNYRSSYLWWVLYSNQTEDERTLNYLESLLTSKISLFELKVYKALSYIVDLWNNKTDIMLEQKFTVQKKSQRLVNIRSLLLTLWYCIFIVIMTVGLVNQKITLGLFISLLNISLPVINTMTDLAENFGEFAKEIMEMKYYRQFMSLPEYKEPKGISKRLKPEIIFDRVKFTYPNTEKPILNGLSFRIHPGESVGIVGVNGAGKSTVIKLLCKLYKPDEGKILIDGIDIQELAYSDLVSILGVVFQDYFKYELTIRENLAFGDLSRINDDDALKRAMVKSQIYSLYSNSDKGLDTNLGKLEEDGIDLSGGQWQRIAIGRVCLSNAAVIILDEPTASLDPIAESEMYSLFFNIMKEKGTIMISHRLASARIAERIIVLDNGSVAETGTHEELIEKNGLYCRMYNEQASWYVKAGEVI